ncbi:MULTISPECIES: PDR/VanB family oxidoreductase [unclassified Variovorax]|uniref:PDR/VanB family oxidoreductase n=1 Tax=unclassified Variovorax TaxID=663243 RepID=UPI000D12A6EE|nr:MULTISPECIES: PDR/VanB family oxidoreductase [unclassified Variovorax]AVQ85423.1 oxidoreductase [Variovorax sp. PMC12]QRY35045.1 oxidoreductase [Variovorax sp. PDNC026]
MRADQDTALAPGTVADTDDPASRIALRVAARRDEAQGIVSFELRHPEGLALPPFDPGAHLLVEAAPGMTRAYSLCNDPGERDRYLIAVLHGADPHGGSAALHRHLVPGMTLRASKPRNAFAMSPAARRSILLGGGIGITPLLAMAELLASRQADFSLHYCTRDAARTAFAQRIASSRFAANTQLHHDDGPASQRFDAERVLARPDAHTHVYVCGPAGFIAHAMSTAQRLGWAESQLHREYFAAPAIAKGTVADGVFDLVLASSGRRIAVNAGQSAAQALQEAGVPLVMSCEQGVCGTCVTTVLRGTPDHRDHYLTQEDRQRNDCFMPCCSRAFGGELVLDL